jgi:Zn-dependent peptidase ImmA (M78 family)
MALRSLQYRQIEDQIGAILSESGINKAPIPIESIAKSLGAFVIAYELGDEVSGVLVINENKGTIGYNILHPKVRQRFTIAHELGHYIMHVPKSKGKQLFVDKDFIVKFRSQKSYTAHEIRQEQEANAFAAAILMPKDILLQEMKSEKYYNLTENKLIEELAIAFNVSIQAMTYRFADLNIFFYS